MATPKECIAQFCKECIYDPTETGSWRQQVEACQMTACPLFPVRPLSLNTIYNKRKVSEVQDPIIPTINV
jgi:hypothetical protein